MTRSRSPKHEEEAQERFDRWSESLTFRRLKPWLSWVQRHALDTLDWAEIGKILDVGCGSGWAVYQSALRLQESERGSACGCDLSVGMLQQRADLTFPPNAHFLASSAQELPFRESCFDALLCTVAFHHFPEPKIALAEFRRILRPRGQLVIADSCRDLSFGLWWWDRLHRWFEKGHVMYYRKEELRQLLSGAGFVDCRVRVLSPSYQESRKLFRRSGLFSARAPS